RAGRRWRSHRNEHPLGRRRERRQQGLPQLVPVRERSRRGLRQHEGRAEALARPACGRAPLRRGPPRPSPRRHVMTRTRRALAPSPNDLLATSGLGSLALSRHRFREALALGRRAVATSPTTARSYGVVGDALVELGRYRQAFAAFDTMARLRPGLAAYARVSYARELRGDVAGARDAMRLALDAAVGQREAVAGAHVQLARPELGHGRWEAAARE